MSEPASQIEPDRSDARVPPRRSVAGGDSRRRLGIACLAAFAVGGFATLMYHPFAQAEGGDNAIWDYVAQCILRGQVPYRDVIEIKTPASAYLSALAILAGKAAGLQDIWSVRLLYVLLVGVLCAVTLLTTQLYIRSLVAGAIAVSILLMWPGLVVMMIAGTRPKVPMILFGLITLVLIAREKPVWAGVCSMLACLCWQPGLLFTAAALLVFTRYLTNWRDARGLKVLIGAAVPLVLAVIYFYVAGALGDFWNWTVRYNYVVYMPEGRETAVASLTRLWYLVDQITGGETLWVKLGAIGFMIFVCERLVVSVKKRAITASPDLFRDALIIVPLMYLIFKIINYPGDDDLIPLMPFIGLFVGYAIMAVSRWGIEISIVRRKKNVATLARWIPALALSVLVIIAGIHGVSYRITSPTLQDQQQMVQGVADLLGPTDKIYVHGTLEILVLLNLPNMNPYIFLDRGKDGYIAARKTGGFGAVMDEMKSQAPKVVAISRTQNVAHRNELLSWVAEQYDRFPVEFAHNSVYVRKQSQ